MTPEALSRVTRFEFLKRVRMSTRGCWHWNGVIESSGYGCMKVKGGIARAHRLAWIFSRKRPIPEGMFVCHKCDNPSCVKPSHLFLGTAKQNTQDMIAKGRRVIAPTARLTEDQVTKIKARLRAGESGVSLAAAFGCSPHTVSKIKCGKQWRHAL